MLLVDISPYGFRKCELPPSIIASPGSTTSELIDNRPPVGFHHERTPVTAAAGHLPIPATVVPAISLPLAGRYNSSVLSCCGYRQLRHGPRIEAKLCPLLPSQLHQYLLSPYNGSEPPGSAGGLASLFTLWLSFPCNGYVGSNLTYLPQSAFSGLFKLIAAQLFCSWSNSPSETGTSLDNPSAQKRRSVGQLHGVLVPRSPVN